MQYSVHYIVISSIKRCNATFSKSVPMNKQTLQLNLQFKISIYILYDLRVSTAHCFLIIEAAYMQIGAWM